MDNLGFIRTLSELSFHVYDAEETCRTPEGWVCVGSRAMGRTEWNFTAAAFKRQKSEPANESKTDDEAVCLNENQASTSSVTLAEEGTADQLVIAFRGTCTRHDLVADLMVAFGKKPHTLHFALDFIQTMQKKHEDHQVILTGHSLGALLAEVAASELQLRAITFESPGSLPLVQAHAHGSRHVNITTFLTRPNVVNTCHRHAGVVYRIVIPARDKERPSFWHVVRCILGTAIRLATLAWPISVAVRYYWAQERADEAAAVAELAGKELQRIEQSFRDSESNAKFAGLLSSLGLVKFERNHRKHIADMRLAQATARATAEIAAAARRDAEDTLTAALKSKALAALLPSMLAYRSGLSFAAATLDDVFRTKRGGQHSMEMIVDALSTPTLQIVHMESWPGKRAHYLWAWLWAELLGLLPMRPYNRGLHSLWRENEVAEAQLLLIPSYVPVGTVEPSALVI